jgi:hypothetical protein
MSAPRPRKPLTAALAALGVGALIAALLGSVSAAWMLEVVVGQPADGGWTFEPGRMLRSLALLAPLCLSLFLLLGPLLHWVLARLGQRSCWAAAGAGGLLAAVLLLLVNPQPMLLVHGVYALIAALSAGIASALFQRWRGRD